MKIQKGYFQPNEIGKDPFYQTMEYDGIPSEVVIIDGIYETAVEFDGVVTARFFRDKSTEFAEKWLEDLGVKYSRKWIGPNVYSKKSVEEYIGLR